MRRGAVFIGALVLCLSCGLTAAAQVGALRGTVRDVRGAPVPAARVGSADGARVALSDSLGAFLLPSVPVGVVPFTIRRIGYEPGTFTAEIRRGETTDVAVTVTSSIRELPGMESRAASPREAVLARFNDHRVSSPGGHFLTRADIEKSNPLRVSDLLRGVPGLSLPTNPAGRRGVRMSRSNLGAFGDCSPVFWLDGSRAADLNIDDLSVRDIEAMEIYAGPATLPADYKTAQAGTACGVIAIWTRVP